MGSKSPSTTTTKQELPPWLNEHMQYGLSQGRNLFENYSPMYYPGSTVSDFSGDTQKYFSQAQNFLSNPWNTKPGMDFSLHRLKKLSNLNTLPGMKRLGNMGTEKYFNNKFNKNEANQYLSGVMEGEYLGKNEHLDDIYGTALNDSMNEQAGLFAQAGRSGMNAAFANAMADRTANLREGIYGRHYESERDRMGQAAGQYSANYDNARARQMAANEAYGNLGLNLRNLNLNAATQHGAYDAARRAQRRDNRLQNLGIQQQIGAMKDAKNQQFLSDDVNRWDYYQQLPFNQLNWLMGLNSGGAGGAGTTSTTQPGGSAAAGLLGGAASGAGIASALGLAGPWGWGLAGAGGLLGIL